MTPRLRACLLSLCLLWQALMWVTPWGQNQFLFAMGNQLAHGQKIEHHHHDDLSVHLSEGAERDGHVHPADALQQPGLTPSATWRVAVLPSLMPEPWATPRPPTVWPEGLLRPPQHRT